MHTPNNKMIVLTSIKIVNFLKKHVELVYNHVTFGWASGDKSSDCMFQELYYDCIFYTHPPLCDTFTHTHTHITHTHT